MKHMQIIVQEPYEAPAISEIAPVTLVYGSAGGGDVSGATGDNDDNTGGGTFDPNDD